MSLDRVRRRAQDSAALADVVRVSRQYRRLAELEIGVRENALLRERLDGVLSELERAVVPVLERIHPDQH
ncbi:hypothetical protein ACFQ0K_03210 [Nocardioides caeni]|uniref:Uncharacterized protein n=1 Tax=Nocardioides caeni TaxID=574700 RepID=A0A4S8NPL6_9ACTN|nr:hypothetical protein [Nocardioides caeni]THV18182.1 hypothetical protein E9934_00585 [Nocardioides caeni]